jgi:hypothetical protein
MTGGFLHLTGGFTPKLRLEGCFLMYTVAFIQRSKPLMQTQEKHSQHYFGGRL